MRSILLGLVAQLGLAASLYIGYDTSETSLEVDAGQVHINIGPAHHQDAMMSGGSAMPDMPNEPDMGIKADYCVVDRGLTAGTGLSNGQTLFITYVYNNGEAVCNYVTTGWVGWINMGGNFNQTLAATQYGGIVYIVGTDRYGALLYKTLNVTSKTFFPSANSWIYLGGDYTGTPSIGSLNNKTLDVIAKKSDTSFNHVNFDPVTQKITTISLGGKFSGYPSLVYANTSSTAGALYAFGHGSSGNEVFTASYAGTQWSGWTSIGSGNFTVSPTAIALGPRIDVLVMNKNGTMSSTMRENGTSSWSTWVNAGSGFQTGSSPTVLWWTDGRTLYLDAWVHAADIKQLRYSPGKWTVYGLGGGLLHNPVAFTPQGSRIDLWGVNGQGTLYYKTYTGGWTGWGTFGSGGKISSQSLIEDAPAEPNMEL